MIRWFIALLGVLLWVTSAPVSAEEQDYSGTADASSTPNAVRVTILRMGGVDRVHSIAGGGSTPGGCSWTVQRSEEHTSELQSLMRNSYAVFCLKKKRKKNNSNKTSQNTK